MTKKTVCQKALNPKFNTSFVNSQRAHTIQTGIFFSENSDL